MSTPAIRSVHPLPAPRAQQSVSRSSRTPETDENSKIVFACALITILSATAAQILISLNSFNFLVVGFAAIFTMLAMLAGIITLIRAGIAVIKFINKDLLQ